VGRQKIIWDLGTAQGEKRLNNLQFLWNFMIDLFIVPVNVYDFPVHFRYGKVVWVFLAGATTFP
jgi:hypothetical protein